MEAVTATDWIPNTRSNVASSTALQSAAGITLESATSPTTKMLAKNPAVTSWLTRRRP